MSQLAPQILSGTTARDVYRALEDVNPNCSAIDAAKTLTSQDIKECLDLTHDGVVDGSDFRRLRSPCGISVCYAEISTADRLLKNAHMVSPFDALRRNWHVNREVLRCQDNNDPKHALCAATTLSALKLFTAPELWHDPEFLDYAGDLNPFLKYFTPEQLHKHAVSAEGLVASQNTKKLQELYLHDVQSPDPAECYALYNDIHYNLEPAMTQLELLDSLNLGGYLYLLSFQWTDLGSWEPTAREYAYNRLATMHRSQGFLEIPMTYEALITACHDAGIDHPERLAFGFVVETLRNRRRPISADRPVWLLIFPKEDEKGSFLTIQHMLSTMMSQRTTLDIRYYEAGSVPEIEGILEDVSNHGEWWINTLWLGAHSGFTQYMSWGFDSQPGITQLRPEDLKSGTRLHDLLSMISSRILLEGCYTGVGGAGVVNMVNAFAAAVMDGVKVTGPRAAAPLVEVCLSASNEMTRVVFQNDVKPYTASK